MRKCLAVLLSLMLLCCCACAWAEDMVTVYQSDFAHGTDGWYARSTGSATVSLAPPFALHTEGRESNWHSPGRDFDLTPGIPYALSVQILQQDVDAAHFMISVAHTAGGVESYENLATGEVKKGEWTTISGDYTPGVYDRFVLYVETTDAPSLSFDIRYFRVKAPAGSPALQAAEDPLPSLREAWAGTFDFGACVPYMQAVNAKAMQFNLSQFSILTHENELKPDSVLDVAQSRKLAAEDETAVAVHFNNAKPLLDFAKENGLKIHGHVLVWHSQTPEAFFHEGYDASRPFVTREVMLGRMEHYIQAVFAYTEENYPGVIVSWDVVNEAIDDGTNALRHSNWYNVVGEDFVSQAFAFARKYAPKDTVLCYNDYNTAMPGKLNGIVKLLESLIAEGNIDAYGFQMHHDVTYPSMTQITAAVERIAALGLKLRVSELDIGIPDATQTSLNRQAKMYAQIMQLMQAHGDQTLAVQVWGVMDEQSWRSDKHPLLFTAGFQPKPAFWAVIDPSSVF